MPIRPRPRLVRRRLPSSTAYTRLLRAARTRGHAIGRAGLVRLRAQFTHAAEQLAAITTESPLTVTRAASLQKQITATLKSLDKAVTSETERGVRVTADQLAELHYRGVRSIVESAGFDVNATALRAAYDTVPIRVVAALNARRGGTAATFRTLYNRHMQDAATDLDTLIGSGIARGVSARTLAKDIATLLGGDRVAGIGATYGLRDTDLSGLKTLWYDARRIAVSEINNTMRETNAVSMQASGIVAAAKWQLSGAHPVEDVCDDIAEADEYGYGPGMYPPDAWPDAPHPFCGCMQGGPIAYKDPAEWPLMYDTSGRGGGVDSADAEPLDVTPQNPWANQMTAPVAHDNPMEYFVAQEVEDAGGVWPYEQANGSQSILRRMWDEQGFNERPPLVPKETVDKLVKRRGVRELWRGVADKMHADQFTSGERYVGGGAYGNGDYTADVRSSAALFRESHPRPETWGGLTPEFNAFREASQYAYDTDAVVMRMALSPTAKVIEYKQLEKEFESWKEVIWKRLGSVERRDFDPALYPVDPHLKTRTEEQLATYIFVDPGRFATLRGYDAILVEDEGYLVLLNRSAVVVERGYYKPYQGGRARVLPPQKLP